MTYQKELQKVYDKTKQELVLIILKNLNFSRANDEVISQDYYSICNTMMTIPVMMAEIQMNTAMGKVIVRELTTKVNING